MAIGKMIDKGTEANALYDPRDMDAQSLHELILYENAAV
jgi:hypothetical protein